MKDENMKSVEAIINDYISIANKSSSITKKDIMELIVMAIMKGANLVDHQKSVQFKHLARPLYDEWVNTLKTK